MTTPTAPTPNKTPANTLPQPPANSSRSARSLGGLLPFLRPYRGKIVLALLFLLLAAVASLCFPAAMRQLIDNGLASPGGASAANATNATNAANAAATGERIMALREYFGLLFGVAAAMGVFSSARFYLMSWLGERVTADVRNAVYAHVLQQSPEFFETTQTGEVLSRLTTDTTLVQTVVGSSFSMGLRNAVMGLGALAMLVWTNPLIMAQVLAVLVLVVLPSVWFGRKVRRLSRASQDRVADSSAIAAEVLNAIPVVQGYTAEQREANRFTLSTENAFATARRRVAARSGLMGFIIVATSAALLWGLYQGTQAVLAGKISAGHMGETVIYIIMLASSFAVLGEVYGDLLRAAGATERLMELLHTRSPITSPAQPLALPASSSAGSASRVVFDGITFHYPSRPGQAALTDFSLTLEPGQTVALVGSSGAGKSTVLQLLLRFYDPQHGQVLLDGVPLPQASLQSLRERMALVPQEAVIFSTSALENIRYGRPTASDEEVYSAARAAFADDFIRALPEGYDTFLGERGVRLSGGQRQRIAIARAMLKNAPLLLLDEATSALDAESERMVQAALESAMRNRTTLVIAHRLATVQQADRIVVMDAGRIVETGTHTELVAAGGLYARLAALQFKQ